MNATPTESPPPACYLSVADGRWNVIHHGLPVSAGLPTRSRAEEVVRFYRLAPAAIWNGDVGAFEPLTALAAQVSQ